MKKTGILICLLLVSVLLCGCSKTDNEKVISNGLEVNTSGMEHKHCTRNATATGADVKLEYDIYYTGDVLNLLKSKEEIISSSDDILNTYEEAYKNIHEHYKGLEYYDTQVVRGDTTVISYMTINYDKVDIDSLIQIEGEKDNIFENKVAKVSKWLELSKKFGTKCELVK